jgi:hypothetical protein
MSMPKNAESPVESFAHSNWTKHSHNNEGERDGWENGGEGMEVVSELKIGAVAAIDMQ